MSKNPVIVRIEKSPDLQWHLRIWILNELKCRRVYLSFQAACDEANVWLEGLKLL